MDSRLKARLNAYEQLGKGREKELRDGDGRVGATHKRMRRGFVRADHGGYTIKYLPPSQWPQFCNLSGMTLRNWIKKDVIRAVYKYGMPMMCRAELDAIKRVVSKWHALRDMHNAIEPQFRAELNAELTAVRLALDALTRHQEIDDHQRHLLANSLEKPDA